MKLLHIRGNHYECGFQLGDHFKEQIAARLLRNNINKDKIESLSLTLKELQKIHEELYPQYVEELKGLAEGSSQDYWALLLLNCPHVLEIPHGCTSIASVAKKGAILAHNEDGVNGDSPEESALIEFDVPDNHFFAFVYAGELPGCAYGWNQYHLFFSVDYLPAVEKTEIMISRYFTARALLDAETLEESLKILGSEKSAGGFHYFIGQHDTLYSVETAKGRSSKKKIEETSVHTNFYTHETFSAYSVGSEQSKKRFEKVLLGLAEDRDIANILFDKSEPSCVYGTSDQIRTLSTVFFYPNKSQIVACQGDTLENALTLDL